MKNVNNIFIETVWKHLCYYVIKISASELNSLQVYLSNKTAKDQQEQIPLMYYVYYDNIYVPIQLWIEIFKHDKNYLMEQFRNLILLRLYKTFINSQVTIYNFREKIDYVEPQNYEVKYLKFIKTVYIENRFRNQFKKDS